MTFGFGNLGIIGDHRVVGPELDLGGLRNECLGDEEVEIVPMDIYW